MNYLIQKLLHSLIPTLTAGKTAKAGRYRSQLPPTLWKIYGNSESVCRSDFSSDFENLKSLLLRIDVGTKTLFNFLNLKKLPLFFIIPPACKGLIYINSLTPTFNSKQSNQADESDVRMALFSGALKKATSSLVIYWCQEVQFNNPAL